MSTRPPILELNLLENGHSSLEESLAKVQASESDPLQWKFAVLHIVHAIELVLKERLHRAHPLLVFENVDRPARYVSLEQSMGRLAASDAAISLADADAIQKAIKWRNRISHSDVNLVLSEVREAYILLFEFLVDFHRKELDQDLLAIISPSHYGTAANLIKSFRAEFVEFQGVNVSSQWPAQLMEAQQHPVLHIGDEAFPRYRWGTEPFWKEWGKAFDRVPCHDCAALIGHDHGPVCDSEACPRCGQQLMGCGCEFDDEYFGFDDLPAGESGSESDETDLSDQDPAVVAGMVRLAELRAQETGVRDLPR